MPLPSRWKCEPMVIQHGRISAPFQHPHHEFQNHCQGAWSGGEDLQVVSKKVVPPAIGWFEPQCPLGCTLQICSAHANGGNRLDYFSVSHICHCGVARVLAHHQVRQQLHKALLKHHDRELEWSNTWILEVSTLQEAVNPCWRSRADIMMASSLAT